MAHEPSKATERLVNAYGRCVCEDCLRIKASDRAELIARVAESYGVPVATGPRKVIDANDLMRLAENIRKRRLENYEPQEDGEAL